MILEGRVATVERLFDRLYEFCPVKRELPGQQPEVVIVLHPTVREPQLDHGLILLGDAAFAVVTSQDGGGIIEQGGIGELVLNRGGVAKANIEPHYLMGRSDMREKANTYAKVISVLGDGLDLEIRRVKDDTVVGHLLATDPLNALSNHGGVVDEPTEHIDVPGRAHGWRVPHPQKQGTLEDELFALRADAQTVEKALDRVVLQELIHTTPTLYRLLPERLTNLFRGVCVHENACSR